MMVDLTSDKSSKNQMKPLDTPNTNRPKLKPKSSILMGKIGPKGPINGIMVQTKHNPVEMVDIKAKTTQISTKNGKN